MKIGLSVGMFLVFLTLKLIGVIAWSWWWVTSPLWIGLAVTIIITVFLVALAYLSNNLKQS